MLFYAHTFEAEKVDKAVEVSIKGKSVVGIKAMVVNVELMEYRVTRCAHLERQVHCNVCVAKMTFPAINKFQLDQNDKFNSKATYQAMSNGVLPRLSRYVIIDRT